MPARIDLTGHRYGKLVGVKHDAMRNGKSHWAFKCDCGNVISVRASSVRSGNTRSCGCVNTSHGMSNHSLYNVWSNIIDRTCNPKCSAYGAYGGRGIGICSRWKDLARFVSDMPPRPSNLHQIDRIDNNKGYCKKNCRWVTSKENNRNTRRNRMIKYGKHVKCVSEWAEITGIKAGTLRARISCGWDIERALTEPVSGKVSCDEARRILGKKAIADYLKEKESK